MWRVGTDWSGDHAISGTIPTGVGTVPMALGYLAIVILWSRARSRRAWRCATYRMRQPLRRTG
ncbi:MAG: hypothetical protein ACKO91_09430 [Acidimicrobiales bacterium]